MKKLYLFKIWFKKLFFLDVCSVAENWISCSTPGRYYSFDDADSAVFHLLAYWTLQLILISSKNNQKLKLNVYLNFLYIICGIFDWFIDPYARTSWPAVSDGRKDILHVVYFLISSRVHQDQEHFIAARADCSLPSSTLFLVRPFITIVLADKPSCFYK